MQNSDESTEKVHYICQTYTIKDGRQCQPSGLQIGKQLQYTSASQAEERAHREFQLPECVGVDAYMVTEDVVSGEVSAPSFIARFGKVPDPEH